jgi:uncharacterized damage-inducible protein DinB
VTLPCATGATMKALDTIRDLFRHMEWADAVVWRAVVASDAAQGDEKLREWLHHIHRVQKAFLGLWTGGELERMEIEDLSGLRRIGTQLHVDIGVVLATLTEERLDAPLPIPWAQRFADHFGRAAEIPTIGETFLQVSLHSTYHRGQVNARLRALGTEPPLTDYIAWIWLGRPSPEWPGV